MPFLDKSGLSRLWNYIMVRLNNKVEIEDGKGLSTNDYTTEEKEQLAALGELVGDSSVSEQITTTVESYNFATKEYVDEHGGGGNAPVIVTAESTDGAAYTATVNGITALTAGVSFIMIPARASSTKGPTLDVNGLGAKFIRRRLSSGATVDEGYTTTWLTKNKPFRLMYDGTQWIVEGHNKPVVADVYGTLPVEKGGTGATTASEALTNLGVYVQDTEPTSAEVGAIWIDTSVSSVVSAEGVEF